MGNPLIESSAKRSEEKVIATKNVLDQMVHEGKLINFYTVADEACVGRQFLYHHEELRHYIENCRITSITKKELQQEVIRLRLRVDELENNK